VAYDTGDCVFISNNESNEIPKKGTIMNKLFQVLAVGTMFALGFASVISAADAADPVIGTWKLNLEKSKFSPAHPAPKSMSRTYAAAAKGTAMTVTGVAADGTPISQQSTLTYDGKDCAFAGSADFDTLTLKKINGTTVKSEQKKDGKAVGTTTRTISDHGKVLTLSSSLKTAKGGTIHDVTVYEKQ
jgi:hypothetical protein